MGGRALKTINVTRISAGEYYNTVLPAIQSRLSFLFADARIEAVTAYATKPDFGDVDILITREALGDLSQKSPDTPPEWVQKVVDHFKPKMWRLNSHILSFEFCGHQVDLIGTPEVEFDWTAHYFAYNDLGNLIGAAARRMGFKLGHGGLWLAVFDPATPGRKLREVCVTRTDWNSMLRLLGYDPVRYHQGFATLEEIFAYATSTRYFSRDLHSLEKRNHKSRTRDVKRPTYTAFLKWVEANESLSEYPWKYPTAVYLDRACRIFPTLRPEINVLMHQLAKEREAKRRFNAHVVSEITGHTGVELGRHMNRLREAFADGNALRSFVLSARSGLFRRFIRTGDMTPPSGNMDMGA